MTIQIKMSNHTVKHTAHWAEITCLLSVPIIIIIIFNTTEMREQNCKFGKNMKYDVFVSMDIQ